MPVYKREGSPFYQYDITVNGRRFRGSTGTDNKDLAKAYATKLGDQIYREGNLNEKPRISVSQACGEYWENHIRFLPSAKSAIPTMRRFIEAFGKSTYLDEVSARMIVNFVTRTRQVVKDESVNRYLDDLIALNNRMETLGYQHCSVKISKHKLPQPEGRTRYLTVEEYEALLEAAPEYLRRVIIFAVHTGVRKDNIITLKWSQVDLDGLVISFRVKSKKRGGKVHTTDITNDIYDILHMVKEKAIEAETWKSSSYVFTRDGVKPLGDFKKAWHTALRKAGIGDFRFHDLRHTHASAIVKAGYFQVAQRSLGHSDIKTTTRYSHLDRRGMRDTLNSVFSTQIRHNKKQEEGS